MKEKQKLVCLFKKKLCNLLSINDQSLFFTKNSEKSNK